MLPTSLRVYVFGVCVCVCVCIWMTHGVRGVCMYGVCGVCVCVCVYCMCYSS